MFQDSFLLLGVNPSSKILVFGGSDIKPVMLKMRKEQNLGLIPFHFIPLWVSHNDFMKIVVEAWSASVMGSPFFIWEEKLRRVKKALEKWAKYLENTNKKKSQAYVRGPPDRHANKLDHRGGYNKGS